MKEFFSRPDIILALILLVGCFVLIGVGIDGDMKGILGTGAGYVFGRIAQNVAK